MNSLSIYFDRDFGLALQRAAGPSERLDVIDETITKIFTLTTDEEMQQRLGAGVFERIEETKNHLVEIAQHAKSENEDPPAGFNELLNKLVAVTERLLVEIFATTPESIAAGLAKYKEEVNA